MLQKMKSLFATNTQENFIEIGNILHKTISSSFDIFLTDKNHKSKTQQELGTMLKELYILPALKENRKIHLNLTGYNRIQYNFLQSLLGNLITKDGYTKEQIDNLISYKHDVLGSLTLLATKILEKAENERLTNSLAK